jgi:hypothetical protein
MLRQRQVLVRAVAVFAAFIAFALAPTSMAWTPAVLLMAAGGTALALSFLINQWSIRNNSRIYKRAAFAVSFLPQDPR